MPGDFFCDAKASAYLLEQIHVAAKTLFSVLASGQLQKYRFAVAYADVLRESKRVMVFPPAKKKSGNFTKCEKIVRL